MTIVRLACGGLVLAALIRPALGQEPPAGAPPAADITLSDPSAVPFSSSELEQALLARSHSSADAPPPPVRIAPAGPGAVVVETGDRSRVVALAERTGPAAARIVALVIAELLSDDAADGESTDASAETSPNVRVSPDSNAVPPPSLVGVPSPAPSGPTPQPRLCVTGGMTGGPGKEELLAYAADADVILPLEYRGVRLAPSAGAVFMPTRDAGNWHEVSYKAGVARLLAGTSLGPVDLFGGPFATRYSIGGINPHAGFLFGAEALARLSVPVSRNARLVVATRAHYYVDRVRVLFVDGTGFATPRFELSLGIGFGWDWSS